MAGWLDVRGELRGARELIKAIADRETGVAIALKIMDVFGAS